MKTVVAGLSNGKHFGVSLAKKSGTGKLKYIFRKFPDGELHIKFGSQVKGRHVVLVQSLFPNPNDALVELFLAARTARGMGAKRVSAITPYLCYMRQDKVFSFGESFSAKEIAWLLSKCVDGLFAFEPHLHRIRSLSEIFSVEAKNLSARSAISDFVLKKFSRDNTVIVGPDRESSQWAKKIADAVGFDSTVLEKTRFGDRKVRVKVTTELDWKNKDVIIIDDIVSTGGTVVQAAKEIRKRKPRAVYCICVHPLLVEGALEKIMKAGVKEFFSCNTIEHKSNCIDLSGVVAKELK